jgi:hypothetical protein
MKFILNENDLSGTVIEKFIQLGTQEKAPEVYTPRKGQIGKNIDKFTDEHIELIVKKASDMLRKFGYMGHVMPD